MTRIDVLHVAGCPHLKPTVDLIRTVAKELAVETELVERDISTSEDAEAHRFLGSPTVRVNGVDIETGAGDREDYGTSCRLYGASGVPPREMVLSALRHEVGKQTREDHGTRPRKNGKRHVIGLLAAFMAACAIPTGLVSSAEEDAAELADLKSVDALRKQFNKDRETPRLLLLLSPT